MMNALDLRGAIACWGPQVRLRHMKVLRTFSVGGSDEIRIQTTVDMDLSLVAIRIWSAIRMSRAWKQDKRPRLQIHQE